MAVSPMIAAIANIFKTPEYASRIPEYVRTELASGNFGQSEYPQDVKNAIMDGLVDKISRQEIYSFEYNNFDASKYEKGYLPYGGIIEDDFIEAMTADTIKRLPSKTNQSTYQFADFDPYKINYPKVSPSYYFLKPFMQYSVTTTYEIMKRAFTSEAGATNFIQRVRGVLPESGKLDRYLLFREMLSTDSIYTEAGKVDVPVAGSTMTAEESISIVKTIRNYVSSVKWNNTQFNKSGVLTSSKDSDLVLFIAEGIYNEISAAQYNAYHKDLDFGCRVQLIDGFGANALTTGQFAVLADERAIKIYKWSPDRMDNIWNPKGEGYWNTFYSFGDLMGYALHANIIQFRLTSA